MNLSRAWLEAFLRRPLDPRELSERLAMLGAPVDAVEPVRPELAPFVVARVLEVGPHPDPKATRVRLTAVDDGTGAPLTVVCGAPNVTAGKSYPFARLGTRMPGPNGFRIEPRPIRGVVSQGMLCSARELGLGEEHDGILELDTDAAPGTPLLEALPLGDHRLIVDVTPNRPDLLGHKGVARELAASYDIPFRLPVIPGAEAVDVPPAPRTGDTAEVAGVSVRIDDRAGCGRFHAAVLRGVTLRQSPAWLRDRLEAVGLRAINNVVDATNYVMLELNQPMHAYDFARLRGPSIIVRRAAPGERLVTLDATDRPLPGGATIIADDGGPIGLAGIMGGAGSEVSDATTDVFLEAAFWDPSSIRRTRRALGMSTDASYRFERGIDRWGGADAMRRCIQLILANGGGELDGAPVDLWPEPGNPPRIFLRAARVAQVLGIELPVREIERCLVSIGATVLAKPGDGRLAVDVPGWRPDLVSEIDLVEEVARQHGYDRFPSELRPFRPGALPDAPGDATEARIRRGVAAQGLFEVSTIPMGPADADDVVRLLNPLSEADGYLRRRLLPNLVRLVEANWAERIPDIRLFELGTVWSCAGDARRPIEERRVAGVLTGRRDPPHWTDAGDHRFDRWDLKGAFEAAIALANPSAEIQIDGTAWVARDASGRVVGEAGLLSADAPPWAAPLYGFELLIDAAPRPAPRFRALPSTPPSERVLALLLP
ncbi:MAG: phenylalanine--tRNA ligase subunit beta, partial [Gemmatimonadales bacterium]|nr:phenylalanine--tRNA ligase subunit beta [Gemmatimonadales bacterium]